MDNIRNSNKNGTRVLLLLLSPLVFTLTGCGTKPGQPAQSFEQGRTQVHRGNFAEGRRLLEDFLRNNPSHHLGSRACFLIAKAELGNQDFADAKDWFGKTIREYPDSEEAHKSKFKLAMISILQGETPDAVQQLKQIERSQGAYAPEISAWLHHLER